MQYQSIYELNNVYTLVLFVQVVNSKTVCVNSVQTYYSHDRFQFQTSTINVMLGSPVDRMNEYTLNYEQQEEQACI